jgi:hypothetical protein
VSVKELAVANQKRFGKVTWRECSQGQLHCLLSASWLGNSSLVCTGLLYDNSFQATMSSHVGEHS